MITAKEARKAVEKNRGKSYKGYDPNAFEDIITEIDDLIQESTEFVLNYEIKSDILDNKAFLEAIKKELKRAGFAHRLIKSGTNRSRKAKLRIYWD